MCIKFKNYIKLIRVKHYTKNILIFLPLFFSGFYTEFDNVLCCLIGFILFSFIASIIYIFNDIQDIEKDKLHPIKKFRPLASGSVTKKEAYFLVVIFLILSLFLAYLLLVLKINAWALCLPLVYIILNLSYSKWLKNIVLVDVIVLVSGFIIRLFFGALIINCEVSSYLYLTVMSGAFYMGFGKRRNEFLKSDKSTRKVLQYYNKDFLDKNMYVCLTLTVVFYSMWVVDPNVVSQLHYNWLIWTIPLLMIILFQYSLAVERDSYGDPVEIISTNKPLLITSIIYIISILIIFV